MSKERLDYERTLFSKLPFASYFTLKSRADSILVKVGNRNDVSCNAYLCVDEGEEIDAYDLSVKTNAEVVRIDDIHAKMRHLKADGSVNGFLPKVYEEVKNESTTY